jgi:hypothetical protein
VRAYGRVNADGSLVVTSSSGVVSSAHFGTGTYCVFADNSITIANTAPVASLLFAGFAAGYITVLPGGCSSPPFGLGVQVNTYDNTGAQADRPFTIVIP